MNDDTTVNPDLSHPYLAGEDVELPVLKALSGPLKGFQYPLVNEEYIIGRDPGSDLVLNETVVSRRHAMIKRKVSEYVICDLESTNGVYLNNLKMNKAVLNNGDLIQIGSCVFQFVRERKR